MAAYLPLLLQAREVEAFGRLPPVAGLSAGKTHSAGVLESGEVLTFGEGSEGKLGHGGTGEGGGGCKRAGAGLHLSKALCLLL